MLVYHGTSAEFLDSIMTDGLKACPNVRNWNCSENAVYFFGDEWYKSNYGEDEDLENKHSFLLDAAKNQTTFILAKSRKDCRPMVLVCEIPDDELVADYSCENMEAAYCVYRDIKPEEIKQIWIGEDCMLLRPYFISSVILQSWYNQYVDLTSFSDRELAIAKRYNDDGSLCDLFSDIELEQIQ